MNNDLDAYKRKMVLVDEPVLSSFISQHTLFSQARNVISVMGTVYWYIWDHRYCRLTFCIARKMKTVGYAKRTKQNSPRSRAVCGFCFHGQTQMMPTLNSILFYTSKTIKFIVLFMHQLTPVVSQVIKKLNINMICSK